MSTLQKKEHGRKTVLAMSSGAAVMSRASAASRNLETPLNFADGIMIAYKASKSALNQGAQCLWQGSRGLYSGRHQPNDGKYLVFHGHRWHAMPIWQVTAGIKTASLRHA